MPYRLFTRPLQAYPELGTTALIPAAATSWTSTKAGIQRPPRAIYPILEFTVIINVMGGGEGFTLAVFKPSSESTSGDAVVVDPRGRVLLIPTDRKSVV